jgi:hypothetical protein
MSNRNVILIDLKILSNVLSVITEDLSLINLFLHALNKGMMIISIIKNTLIGPINAMLE